MRSYVNSHWDGEEMTVYIAVIIIILAVLLRAQPRQMVGRMLTSKTGTYPTPLLM
jgi:hypothetical protein